MSQPVWTLSVDLQTKTATFTSGLADAAKGARSSFEDIKSGAQEMGATTNVSMTEARHGVMLLGEEFGVHLPRALTSFIASIGPVGAAMEAAFPFLAIIVGATLLLEHLSKLKEEGVKLSESQTNFGTTVANVLNSLDQKLLEAGIRADELNHDHLGALNKQLQLIDRASLNELVQSFGVVAKAADATFAELKTSWYQWGQGSAGAKNALEQFKTQYDSLLAQGKDKEANDLLAGTRQSAEQVLALQKQAMDNQYHSGQKGQHVDSTKFEAAKVALQKEGIGFTQKEVEAQETLVEALQAQANVQDKVNQLKAAQKSNAGTVAQNGMDADADKAFKERAEAERHADEDAEKEREERYRKAVAEIQENEKLKIDATKEGSMARLQAIDAGIKEENAKGLQETGFYKSLLTTRTEAIRQFTDEEKKLKAEADREVAEQDLKMGELQLAADRDHAQLVLSAMRNSEQQRIQDEIKFADQDFALKSKASAAEIAALDKTDNDYQNKLKALQDKQLQLTKAHEDQVTQVVTKAEEDRNKRMLSAQLKADDEIARSATQLLMRKESISKAMISLGDQVMAGLMQNAIKSILADNMTQERDAAAAARKAFLAGENTIPGVPGVILGGVLAAGAFASVMAFEGGGIVPGVGTGDTVPAMLEPGEGVLTEKVMKGLTERAAFGDADRSSGSEIHIHHNQTNHIHAIDADGVHQMLREHGPQFTDHAVNTLRKMNR
jgi:hypothetical protein